MIYEELNTEYPCRKLPQEQWCDSKGAGGFMGHTCQRLTPIEKAIKDILNEFNGATHKFGDFSSAHEGYAVLLEEVDELWEEIKKKDRLNTPNKMKKEAIQVTAMGLRFIIDCC